MKYLLDADWVVDYLAGDPAAQGFIDGLRPDGIAISIIVYTEIYEGIYGGRNPRQAERVFRVFLHGIPILPISQAVARCNARLRADLRSRKLPVAHRALDLLIAATALH